MVRPNILFLLPDQLCADFVGCYGAGFLKTPSIDALARVCQTNAIGLGFSSEGNLSGGKKGAPLGESSITVGLEVLSAVEMALRVEVVEGRGVDRDELL